MSPLDERDVKISKAMGLEGKYPPFIDMLGLEFIPTEGGNICIKLALRDELALRFRGGVLNGAVISAMMDIIGGAVVTWRLKDEVEGLSLEEQARKLSKVSTVDMRVDYLRPAKGKVFTATGSVLRRGRGIAVTRMELHNEENTLIAVGSGTYTVG
ncbi:MAG: thioesterase family protein [Dehalococcoidia bacterium]|nr:MAG: thioesterase family protein [Dehalococcoidia bacterium]